MVQKILILASNPRGDLKSVNREVDDLVSSLERLENFKIISRVAPRPEQLRELFAERPQIVHFCGHGTGEQGLVLQDEEGREQLVSTELLVNLFRIFPDDISCTVLNACDSEYQAKAIVEHINYVIGMKQPILDASAHIFAVGFYDAFAKGLSIEQAYRLGCWAIQEQESKRNSQSTQSSLDRKAEIVGQVGQPKQLHLAEHTTPVLLSNKLLPSSSTEIDFVPPELVEFTHKEIDRKEYKDDVRAAYDNFGQFSAQNKAASSESESESAQRKILLKKVKKFWIEGFLQSSLQGSDAFNFDLQARPDAIADLSQGIEALSVELDTSYERIRETRIYKEIGQGRTLLILGSPGSGKTIALLQLTQRLIERSERGSSLPLPVVFNLSSWAKDRKSIVDWLIDELQEKYQVPKSLSESWITKQQLILLLDGLDEVQEAYRNDCVRALNEFIGLFPQTEITICSRVRDYEALTERLQISSALCLQPLSSEQVYQFLDNVGGSLAGLKALLKNDRKIEQFAQTPLILHLMSIAYQGWSVENLLPQLRSTSNRLQHVFDTYIDRRLARGATSEYSKDNILHWLNWLASQMVQENQTIFLIEKMQPHWLQTNLQRSLYRIGTILSGVLIIGLILLLGQALSLNNKEISLNGVNALNAAMWGLVLWWKFGRGNAEIETFETLTWPWKKTQKALLNGLIHGLSWSRFLSPIGIVWCRVTWTNPEELSDYTNIIVFGLILGLILGLMIGLIRGLRGSEIETRTIPNQGIWRSGRNAAIVVVICWVILSLIIFSFPQGLQSVTSIISWGLILGLLFGGGITCIQHFILRLILLIENFIPWNYARFLDFTSDRLLMKKVGGGYVFFHRMLLEHFAQMARSRAPVSVITEPISSSITNTNPQTNTHSSNANSTRNTAPQPSNSVQNRIICGNCGHPNPTDGKFCNKCGRQLIKRF